MDSCTDGLHTEWLLFVGARGARASQQTIDYGAQSHQVSD